MKSPVKRTKSPAKHEETTMRGRCPTRIYALNRPRFANLPKIPNPDTKLLEKYFSYFIKKNLGCQNYISKSWRCSPIAFTGEKTHHPAKLRACTMVGPYGQLWAVGLFFRQRVLQHGQIRRLRMAATLREAAAT
jgi:hypothetical protein